MAIAAGGVDRRTSRLMAGVYVVVAVALVLVAIRALRPPQPPPPPTAEFAPQALQELKQAPPQQTSQSGTAPGGAGGANGSASVPSPSPEIISEPAVKPCASAQTQIPDTQSAPCVPYWQGNNGGATWNGVTGTEIRINIPDPTWDSGSPGSYTGETQDLVAYFNSHFETYGRRVVVVAEYGCSSNPSGMQSNADKYAKLPIFASTGCADSGGLEDYYYDRLAKDGVVSVADRADTRTEAHYQQFAPFEWNYTPSLDVIEDDLGQLGCQLKGQAPKFTTPNPLWRTRKFGLVYTTYTGAPSPDIGEIQTQLSACGIDVSKDTLPIVDNGNSTTDQSVVQSAITDETHLQNDQVTSVICVCHVSSFQVLERQANGSSYMPEWMLSSYEYNDQEENEATFGNDPQWGHVIEASVWNKWVPEAERPWYQAVKEVDPSFSFNTGVHPGADDVYYQYRSLLLLFSGIQMAGPNLTPYTFQQGLERTHFPNPASPIFEGTAGFNTFGTTTHTMVKDTALIWVSTHDTGTYAGSAPTAYCYLHHGARVFAGRFPSDPAYYDFQTEPCDT